MEESSHEENKKFWIPFVWIGDTLSLENTKGKYYVPYNMNVFDIGSLTSTFNSIIIFMTLYPDKEYVAKVIDNEMQNMLNSIINKSEY